METVKCGRLPALHAYSREQNLSVACHKKLRRCRVLCVVMQIVLLFHCHVKILYNGGKSVLKFHIIC